MKNNENAEIFIHLSRERLRLKKESKEFAIKIKSLFIKMLNELRETEDKLDGIDNERILVDYIFNHAPQPLQMDCLKRTVSYDEKQWKLMIEYENPPFTFNMDVAESLLDYYQLVFSTLKDDFLNIFDHILKKSHHLKTTIERLAVITWTLVDYNNFLLQKYTLYTAETMHLYRRDENEGFCYSNESEKKVYPELMMLNDAASFLDIPVSKISKMIRNQKIPFCRKEQILYFRRTELEKWIRNQQTELLEN